jgi:uncharacterized membrane protein
MTGAQSARRRVKIRASILPAGILTTSHGIVHMLTFLLWTALVGGCCAAVAALYGHYFVLPGWLTGPEICQLEDGGCAVLFRSPRSRLLGVPNAALGLVLYLLLATGIVRQWPAPLLFLMTIPAIAMSAFLGWSLIVNHRQCRICWTGHLSNIVLFVILGAETLNP